MSDLIFGNSPQFCLQTVERQLLVDGVPVAVGARALDLLEALLLQRGETVSRRSLMAAVWPGTVIDDNNLNVQVNALRRLLGRESIITVPGRGYRLVLAGPVSEGSRTPAPTTSMETNLSVSQVSLVPMVGREEDLQALELALREQRLVTLLGTGGVGKSLLSQHLVQRLGSTFRDGAVFIALADHDALSPVWGTLAGALRVRLPEGVGARDLALSLSSAEALVVLDGAEHMANEVAELVVNLHELAQGVHVLVTSQIPLKLSFEHLHRLLPLALPAPDADLDMARQSAAINLFVKRARNADSRFELTQSNVTSIVRLCHALDGLPLALEMAAWRVPRVGIQHLADRLPDDFHLLASQYRDVPARHRSLSATLDWTHQTLDPLERVVFRRFGIFVGTVELPVIEAVVCDEDDERTLDRQSVVEALSTLVDRSLVTLTEPTDGVGRFRMLDAPRAYARSQLAASGEMAALARRHALAYATRFESAIQDFWTGSIGQQAWVDRFRPDITNARLALRWAESQGHTSVVMQILPALAMAMPREDIPGSLELMRLGMSAARSADHGIQRLTLLVTMAYLYTLLNHPTPNILRDDMLDEAQRWEQSHADARWLHLAYALEASERFVANQVPEGLAALASATALHDDNWPPTVQLQRWHAEIWKADRHNDSVALYRATERYAALSRRAGLPVWKPHLNMINACVAVGRWQEALEHAQQVRSALGSRRDLRIICETAIQTMPAMIELGLMDQAFENAREVFATAHQLGHEAFLADYLSLVLAHQGRVEAAAEVLGYGDQRNRERAAERARNEAMAVQDAERLILETLSSDELSSRRRWGSHLSQAEVSEVAFGAPLPRMSIGIREKPEARAL